jgi:hypothetical protein
MDTSSEGIVHDLPRTPLVLSFLSQGSLFEFRLEAHMYVGQKIDETCRR